MSFRVIVVFFGMLIDGFFSVGRVVIVVLLIGFDVIVSVVGYCVRFVLVCFVFVSVFCW